MKVSKPEYAIFEYQQINLIAKEHCPYLNVLHPKNEIPEHQQNFLDVTAHIWTFRSLKSPFLTISKSTHLQFGTTQSEPLVVWKRNSWTSSNRPPCRTPVPIYEWSKLENTIPEHQQIEVHSCRHYPYLNVSQREYAIPYNSKSTSLPDLTAHIWTFRTLKTRLLIISKSTLLQVGTAHTRTSRSL